MSLGGCQANTFRKPGVEGWRHDSTWLLCAIWKLRLCWNMILGVKNVHYLPEKGLAVGRKIPVGRRLCDTWCKCGPRILGDDLCSPPHPPMGLSHGPPVGTPYILPFWGGPDQRHSGWGHPGRWRMHWGWNRATQPTESYMGQAWLRLMWPLTSHLLYR